MVSRNLPHHKTTKRTSKRQEHTHESPNAFMRRRGASDPETFPITRCTNTQARDKNTHARMSELLHEKERCMVSRNRPYHKKTKHTT